MLTFTDQHDNLRDGTKTMTTRVDRKIYYFDAWCRGIRKLHLFWRNPMNHQPDCYKIGIVEWEDCERKLGVFLDVEDATRDGFDTLRLYKRRIGELNDMSWQQVDRHLWTLIKWKRDGWIEGPHPRKVARCARSGMRRTLTTS